MTQLTMPGISPLAGPMNRVDAERLAHVLKALADPARLRLLSFIESAPHHEACVRDLTETLGLAQPTVSHHLRVLAEAGLLERVKHGVWAYYHLVPSAMTTLGGLLTLPGRRTGSRPGRRTPLPV